MFLSFWGGLQVYNMCLHRFGIQAPLLCKYQCGWPWCAFINVDVDVCVEWTIDGSREKYIGISTEFATSMFMKVD